MEVLYLCKYSIFVILVNLLRVGYQVHFVHCTSTHAGISLGLIWSQITTPYISKNEQKLSKMVFIIPNFLVLHFGENFMKIRLKIPKLQMHEKLQKNVNENMFSFIFFMQFFMYFYGGQLKQLYTANFLYIFNPGPYKMAVPVLVFPI